MEIDYCIIDIAVPGDFNVARSEDWKVEKYQDLYLSKENPSCRESHSTSCENSAKANDSTPRGMFYRHSSKESYNNLRLKVLGSRLVGKKSGQNSYTL